LDKNSKEWVLKVAGEEDPDEESFTSFTTKVDWPEEDSDQELEVEWECVRVSPIH